MKRIIIAGGRDFIGSSIHMSMGLTKTADEIVDEVFMAHTVDLYPQDITIVSGGARGADLIGVALAKHYNTNVCIYPAQWHPNGEEAPIDKAAGHKRNALMAANADVLLAFWDGKSKGTESMINMAKKKGLQVDVTEY